MKLFECKVRLHGSPLNEVIKTNVTNAEMRALRHIHGEDAVLEVEEIGNTDRSEIAERERLAFTYGDALVRDLFAPVRASIDDAPAERPEPREERAPRRAPRAAPENPGPFRVPPPSGEPAIETFAG